MGFKASLFAVGPGIPRADILGHSEGGADTAREAAERLLPGRGWTVTETATMDEGCYPGGERGLYLATFGPTTVAGGPVVLEERDALFAAASAAGLMAWELNIHSVVDLCEFEVRETDGAVRRHLEMTADMGADEVTEQAVGQPLPFEVPYWSGVHSADYDDYPHAFHPLELGEAAIAWIFGTQGEGAPPDDVQATLGEPAELWDLPMHRLEASATAVDEPRRPGFLGRMLGR